MRYDGSRWIPGDPFPKSATDTKGPSQPARTFAEAERTYRSLHERYTSGELSFGRFQEEVGKIAVMDDAGTWWRIQPSDGSFVRHDGSSGEPLAKPPPVAGAPPPAGEGLATVRLLKALALGMKKGFVRSIPLVVVSMAAIGGIHTLLVLFVKKGAQTGNPHPLVASILILPGHEAAGMLFWGLLVGLSISFITKVRHGQLPGTLHKVVTTPGFIQQSFDRTGFEGLLLFLLGSAIALLFAGIVANVLVSLQCILFCASTLVAQRESLMVLFLEAIGSDISKGLHFTGYAENISTYLSIAGMMGATGGFILSCSPGRWRGAAAPAAPQT